MPHEFTLPSFAKINWTLHVLGKRDDGYHELCTLFQTVSLHDTLTFSDSEKLVMTCDNKSVPVDEKNLIIRAGSVLTKRLGIGKGAGIHLKKRIPSPGGLGGGSSNAAVALVGLTKLWNISVSYAEMAGIAAEIGSDVPFFLHGGTALGTGRGEILEPAPDVDERFLLVVIPGSRVSTREAFARLDTSGLTKQDPVSILRVCRFMAGSGDLRDKTLTNDFEPSVISIEPEIARVKKALLELGAVKALMSGSGASVFAIFDKEETRQAALKALEIESNWRKFAVATISRKVYRETLNLAY